MESRVHACRHTHTCGHVWTHMDTCRHTHGHAHVDTHPHDSLSPTVVESWNRLGKPPGNVRCSLTCSKVTSHDSGSHLHQHIPVRVRPVKGLQVSPYHFLPLSQGFQAPSSPWTVREAWRQPESVHVSKLHLRPASRHLTYRCSFWETQQTEVSLWKYKLVTLSCRWQFKA